MPTGPPAREAPPPATDGPSQYDQLLEMLAEGQPRVPPLWARLLARLLRRLLISVGFAAVALLIFGPLFSPAFRAGLKNIRPGAVFRDLFGRLRRQMRILSRLFRSWMRGGLWRRGFSKSGGH